jgi:hypothetical protein
VLPLDNGSHLGYNDYTQKQITEYRLSLVGTSLWERNNFGSNPNIPTHKTHFMKMQEISELQSFTVEEFQSDFDNLMERIEKENHSS